MFCSTKYIVLFQYFVDIMQGSYGKSGHTQQHMNESEIHRRDCTVGTFTAMMVPVS